MDNLTVKTMGFSFLYFLDIYQEVSIKIQSIILKISKILYLKT